MVKCLRYGLSQHVPPGGLTPKNETGNKILGYTYDAVGNLLSDGTHTYVYDAENRIVSGDNGSFWYIYDAHGRRVRRNGTESVEYLYDNSGSAVTTLSATDGSWIRSEISAGGHNIGTYADSTTYFAHTDWLGTQRARTQVDGGLHEWCTNLPFGDAQACTGSDPTPRHFTGKERDNETGLDNFIKRYHASSLGRFMSPDPLMILKQKVVDPQQWNMYSYSRNNPLRFTDPTGQYVCDGNKADCAQIKAGYQAAQKALAAAKPNSEQAKQLKSVLGFLGKPGQANGVAVRFGKLDTGTVAQTITQSTRDLLGKQHTTTEIKFDLQQLNGAIRITSGHPLGALENDTGATLVHEGTHGRDNIASGHDPQSRAEALRTERNAYRNEGYFYDVLGVPSYVNPSLTAPGANRSEVIERLANASAAADGW